MPQAIYSAQRIYTGSQWLKDHVIITDGGLIADIVPVGEIPSEHHTVHKGYVVPAFIDAQLYGANEKLLAVFPTAETVQDIVDYSKAGGAAFCLPTVGTHSMDVIRKCIDAVREFMRSGSDAVPGIHIEGPWINAAKKGAHVESFIHSPTKQEVIELLNYGKNIIKIITLAPEVCEPQLVRMIQDAGIIVSAGHSDATYEEAMKAFSNGIHLVTHLYNAMSPLHHRAPGLVGAVLEHPGVMSSIVPDGNHVSHAAMRIAQQVMKDRLFVITDAVTETNQGYYHHHLEGDKYVANGVLSGSSLTMVKALQILVNITGIHLDEAIRMCSVNPARALGMDHEIGTISKGKKAKLLFLDNQLQVTRLVC